MSDEPTERDVDALAKELRRTAVTRPSASWYEDIRRSVKLARAILASDWYVERIAESRREGAAEIVARVKSLADAPHVVPVQTLEGVENAPVIWPHEVHAALRGEDA